MEAIKKAVGFKDTNPHWTLRAHFFLSEPLAVFTFLDSISGMEDSLFLAVSNSFKLSLQNFSYF